MIASAKVQEIERLLATKQYSQRRIAKMAGVSRATVAGIAAGRKTRRVATADLPDEPVGPPARCPGCGGMVYMPCLLCLAREEQKKHPLSRESFSEEAAEVLTFQFRPDHRRRHEEILARINTQNSIR